VFGAPVIPEIAGCIFYADAVNFESYVRYTASGPVTFNLWCCSNPIITTADKVRKATLMQ
jgi:hypothetical protein